MEILLLVTALIGLFNIGFMAGYTACYFTFKKYLEK